MGRTPALHVGHGFNLSRKAGYLTLRFNVIFLSPSMQILENCLKLNYRGQKQTSLSPMSLSSWFHHHNGVTEITMQKQNCTVKLKRFIINTTVVWPFISSCHTATGLSYPFLCTSGCKTTPQLFSYFHSLVLWMYKNQHISISYLTEGRTASSNTLITTALICSYTMVTCSCVQIAWNSVGVGVGVDVTLLGAKPDTLATGLL
jgi:hypothetical protein